MTRPRSQIVSLADTPYYHCISRCGHHHGTPIEFRPDTMVDTMGHPSNFLLDVLVECGLARSRRIARDLVASGAVSANNAVQSAGDDPLDPKLALHGRYFVIRRGKKNFHLAKLV